MELNWEFRRVYCLCSVPLSASMSVIIFSSIHSRREFTVNFCSLFLILIAIRGASTKRTTKKRTINKTKWTDQTRFYKYVIILHVLIWRFIWVWRKSLLSSIVYFYLWLCTNVRITNVTAENVAFEGIVSTNTHYFCLFCYSSSTESLSCVVRSTLRREQSRENIDEFV